MPLEDSRETGDWLRLAERDLGRVERCLAFKDPELAAFCLQQAIEKFLKGFLLSKGWELRRHHDLAALLDEAATYDAALAEFRGACQRITAFYTVERYPLPVRSGISAEDVQDSLKSVLSLVGRIRQAVG